MNKAGGMVGGTESRLGMQTIPPETRRALLVSGDDSGVCVRDVEVHGSGLKPAVLPTL